MPHPIVCRLAAAALAAAASPAAADMAVEDLAGWWLSIDDTHPALWRRGISLPGEELLVIGADGAAESRLMRFFVPDPALCGPPGSVPGGRSCSDAPVVGTADAAIEHGRLAFTGRRAGEAYDLPEVDVIVRGLTVTAAPAWSAELAAGGNRLTLESLAGEAGRRIFARVEPARLGRLRAGFVSLERSATTQWRCFLAAMTAGDPAFAGLGPQAPPPPAWVEDWLAAQSYRATLLAYAAWPPGSSPPAPVLAESFGAAPPASAGADQELRHILAYLALRGAGMTDAEAGAMVGVDAASLPVGEAALAASARSPDPVIQAMVSCPEPAPD